MILCNSMDGLGASAEERTVPISRAVPSILEPSAFVMIFYRCMTNEGIYNHTRNAYIKTST